MPTELTDTLDTDTKLVGVAFALDPVLGGIDTPNGRVSFSRWSVSQRELDPATRGSDTQRVERLIDMMRKDNPLLITDLKR